MTEKKFYKKCRICEHEFLEVPKDAIVNMCGLWFHCDCGTTMMLGDKTLNGMGINLDLNTIKGDKPYKEVKS